MNEGTETFTILSGATVIGVPKTVNVSAGAAAAIYILPAGTPAGPYVIQAAFNGTNNFAKSSGTNALTVSATVGISSVSVHWGSQTASLFTATDGLRLLPSGRSTDLPWFNINQISLVLWCAGYAWAMAGHLDFWKHGRQTTVR